MRLVLDTNIAISGLLWDGPPAGLIRAGLAGRCELISSTPLLAELEGVLGRAKFTRRLGYLGLTVDSIFAGYAALVEIVVPQLINPVIARDPADDQVLAAALAGRADLIVSGDDHLLDLGSFNGMAIVSATDAIARL